MDATTPESVSEIEVDFKEISDFLDDMTAKQRAVSEATGSLRSALKQKLDETGWHKGAVAMIRKIDGMSPTKRADFRRTFDALYDELHAKKWADDEQDLFDDNTQMAAE